MYSLKYNTVSLEIMKKWTFGEQPNPCGKNGKLVGLQSRVHLCSDPVVETIKQ